MRLAIVAALALTLTGCLTEANFRSETLPRAAFDLGCPVDKVVVTELGDGNFGVSGCGKKAVYVYVPRVGYVNNLGVLRDGPPPAPRVAQASSPSEAPLAPPLQSPRPPPADEFVVVPIETYLLRAHGDNSTAFATEVPNVMQEVNRIFAPAGIYFYADGAPKIVELGGEVPWQHSAVRDGLPPATGKVAFRVFFVRDLDVNGAGLGGGNLVVQEHPGLKAVGGAPAAVANPVARVVGHVLGSSLGLAASQDSQKLMALGTTGTLLDAPSASTLRASAKQMRGAKTMAEAARTGSFPEAVSALRTPTSQ